MLPSRPGRACPTILRPLPLSPRVAPYSALAAPKHTGRGTEAQAHVQDVLLPGCGAAAAPDRVGRAAQVDGQRPGASSVHAHAEPQAHGACETGRGHGGAEADTCPQYLVKRLRKAKKAANPAEGEKPAVVKTQCVYSVFWCGCTAMMCSAGAARGLSPRPCPVLSADFGGYCSSRPALHGPLLVLSPQLHRCPGRVVAWGTLAIGVAAVARGGSGAAGCRSRRGGVECGCWSRQRNGGTLRRREAEPACMAPRDRS